MSWRSRPVDWRNESYRHYLAAKGIKSKHDWEYAAKKEQLPSFERVYADADKIAADRAFSAQRLKLAQEIENAYPAYGVANIKSGKLPTQRLRTQYEGDVLDEQMAEKLLGDIDSDERVRDKEYFAPRQKHRQGIWGWEDPDTGFFHEEKEVVDAHVAEREENKRSWDDELKGLQDIEEDSEDIIAREKKAMSGLEESPEQRLARLQKLKREINRVKKKTNTYGAKKRIEEDMIEGGLGDKVPRSKFNKNSVNKGIKIEMEHTDNPVIAAEIARDHLTEDPQYYEKLERMEAGMCAEAPKKGRRYPVSPNEVKKRLAQLPEEQRKGLKGVEFVNPKGEQKGAWAQYIRSKKKIKIFSQPNNEVNARTNQHMKDYVIPHEVGHHRALRGGKTDKSLAVAEARADANVAGMDPWDKDIKKLVT